MSVRVRAKYEPDPDEVDNDHPSGLTTEAHEKLTMALMDAGLTDIDIG